MTVSERIKRIIDNFDKVIEISKAEAVNQIYGVEQQRIFNEGKDKQEQQIGKYSPKTVEIRKEKGFQTKFVDLTFSGNLKQSIKRTKDAIYFGNTYGRVIADKNEKHFSKRIFAPSQKEREIWFNILTTNLNELWTS